LGNITNTSVIKCRYKDKCKVSLSAWRGPEESVATIENLNPMTALHIKAEYQENPS